MTVATRLGSNPAAAAQDLILLPQYITSGRNTWAIPASIPDPALDTAAEESLAMSWYSAALGLSPAARTPCVEAGLALNKIKAIKAPRTITASGGKRKPDRQPPALEAVVCS